MLRSKKENLKKVYYKIKNKIWTIPTLLMLMPAKVFATDTGDSSISTAEVNQATENIKNAVIKLAMPIGGILVFVSIVIEIEQKGGFELYVTGKNRKKN